jgi:hypothetical protein
MKKYLIQITKEHVLIGFQMVNFFRRHEPI